DLETIRQQQKVRRALEGQAPNPLVELLAGGLQSVLQNTPIVSGEVHLTTAGLELAFKSPLQSEWIPEERTFYFGPEMNGRTVALPQVDQTVLTLSTWRNVSEMWLRAGDLFDADMNDRLAEADTTLTTLFSGKDFAEDILGSFEPEFGLIVARQEFADGVPVPAIRLPSFALVLTQKTPEETTRELRRIFQSLIGFLNIAGANEGRPQLELDFDRTEDSEIITSTYIPDAADSGTQNAPLIFNFSPSIGFRGKRTVISSTSALAQQILNGADAEDEGGVTNTHAQLNADALQLILSDNREQLVSQNMLSEGHTREEAETAIDLLLQVVGYFQDARLSLSHDQQTLMLRLAIHVENRN
ncbi:MAG: hypothetical protein KDA96_17310, partial [Planctomycetaceae bacterium]|nr:hypothetical protein [Planctomycetaceae bacterium]